MKKFLLGFFVVMFLAPCVQAKNIKAIALEDFSTQNPSPVFKVQIIDSQRFKNGQILRVGTLITGHVIKVYGPRSFKRNGYFELVPVQLQYRDKIRIIEKPQFAAKVVGYRPLNTPEVFVSTAKKAVGFVFKGSTQGISFVEGVVGAEEGERIKSGLVKVYKDSPLSYVEPGSDLSIQVGDTLILKIKEFKE